MSTYKVRGYRVIAEYASFSDAAGARGLHTFDTKDDARVAAWDVLGKSTNGGSISGRELIDWVIVQEYRTIEAGIGFYVTIEVLTTRRAASQLGVALYNPDMGIDFDLNRVIDQPQPSTWRGTCSDCGAVLTGEEDIKNRARPGMGYATTLEGTKICYSCCATRDIAYMKEHGKITLYLVERGTDKYVTNWPNSMGIKVVNLRKSAHNMARWRYDVWFVFEGFYWHGVTVGDNTQLCHCKRTKTPVNPPAKTHYVGMAGLRGYMPNYVTVGETRGQCAEDLGQVHELSGRAIKRLRRDCWLDLDLYEYGNEYCEISECDCGKSFEECSAEVDY